MKYVIVEATKPDSSLKVELPLVFSNFMVHADMAEALSKVLLEKHGFESKPVAAGEYNIISGSCHGRSTTLNLASRGNVDEQVINLNDYGFGYL